MKRLWPQRRADRIVLYLVITMVLLGINLYAAHRATQPPQRIQVPYSPFFLEQVRANNVASITSIGNEIQGDFRQATKPPDTSTETKLFTTLIPAFADTNQLSKLLQDHDVVVNAQPLQAGTAWW